MAIDRKKGDLLFFLKEFLLHLHCTYDKRASPQENYKLLFLLVVREAHELRLQGIDSDRERTAADLCCPNSCPPLDCD